MKKIGRSLGIYTSAPVVFGEFEDNIPKLLEKITKRKAILNFHFNEIQHILYPVEQSEIKIIIEGASKLEKIYIADGHHRFETYSSLAEEFKNNSVKDSSFFPVIMFPSTSLTVHHYNRLIHTSKGKSIKNMLE